MEAGFHVSRGFHASVSRECNVTRALHVSETHAGYNAGYSANTCVKPLPSRGSHELRRRSKRTAQRCGGNVDFETYADTWLFAGAVARNVRNVALETWAHRASWEALKASFRAHVSAFSKARLRNARKTRTLARNARNVATRSI